MTYRNKKTHTPYRTVKFIAGTKLAEVTTRFTKQPYIVNADSIEEVNK